MVTIIKNQLLKHLSRYTKNLSPEQISLSALRGSGELHDLTLDEDLLTDLLELPGWVRLTSAKCNRATFRIQWTKLKSVPIALNLDEVHIALEVCEEPRVVNPGAAAAAVPIPGKYSFVHKVIDGISVAVNQVQVDFSCDAFTSTVQISRVTVESRMPDGRKGDLRMTRIKSPDTGQLLLFKELEWQSARIEARPRTLTSTNLPPLRLLLGTAHCRIVIKKRLSDCAVIGSRLVFIPEAVSWALTDGQLRAAMACVSALATPVHRATRQATRAKAARKVEEPLEQIESRTYSGDKDVVARMFAKHDVKETSYHLLASRIDFHLCDDPGMGRSDKPSLQKGGALQITMVGLQADFFPYHRASSDRRHWRGYREAATPHSQWLSQTLTQFCSTLLDLIDPRPLSPTPKNTPKENPDEPLSNGVAGSQHTTSHNTSNIPSSNTTTSQATPIRTKTLQQLGKLMTTCLVLRIDNFTVYKVSTGSVGGELPRPMISGEKTTMPGDAGLLHAELTYFYYPGDVCFPVPPPQLYVQLSPVRVCVCPESVVWVCALLPHLASASVSAAAAVGPEHSDAYMDVRAEVIMPKIVLEAGSEHVSQQRDRPRELYICTARASLTNVRESSITSSSNTRAELASILSALRRSAPSSAHFPSSDEDLDPIKEAFTLHADSLDDIPRRPRSVEWTWSPHRGMWSVRCDPVWIDSRSRHLTAPLLDAVPLSAWIYTEDALSRIYVVARLCGLACLQLNHYQMLFLLRQLEKIADMTAWIAHDAARLEPDDKTVISVAAVVPSVELSLVLPSSCPGQESSRDLDSVPPDSSSLQDMKLASSDTTMAPGVCERDSMILPLSSLDMALFSHPLQDSLPSPSPVSVTNVNFSGSRFDTGLSSMRRGLTSLVDAALGRDDTRSDISVASSDSDRYIVVGLGDEQPDHDRTFREFEQGRDYGVEVADEVVERESSPSEHSVTSSYRRKDIISTCTWHLNNVYLSHQSVGDKSRIKVVGDELKVDECASIPWDEFQNDMKSKFSMRARAWSERTLDVEDEYKTRDTSQVAARLVREKLPRKLDDKGTPTGLAPYKELLEAKIRDIKLDLNMSTVLALSEFIEDEVLVEPMPIQLEMVDVRVRVLEDRASRCISSAPRDNVFHLTHIYVHRDSTGEVKVGTIDKQEKQPSPTIEAPSYLLEENTELRRRLAALARIADDNRELRAKAEEASALRQCVHAAQQEAATLLADKQNLLDIVRSLQEQLSCRGKR